MKEHAQVTTDCTANRGTQARIVRELEELIAALDRRLPQVQRAGEVVIAKAAAALKAEALKRIDEIEGDSRSLRLPADREAAAGQLAAGEYSGTE